MRSFELPERLKRFLTPGVILLSLLFLTSGLYFWNQSLAFSPKTVVDENEGVVSGAETNVPDSFPKDIPFFEPKEILSSQESKERTQITFQVEASAERVTQFYEREMLVWGWQPAGSQSFFKNGRRAEITVVADPEGLTTIILTVTF